MKAAAGCFTPLIIAFAFIALIAQCAPDDDPDTGGSSASSTEPSSSASSTEPSSSASSTEPSSSASSTEPSSSRPRNVGTASRYAPSFIDCQRSELVADARAAYPPYDSDELTPTERHSAAAHGHLLAAERAADIAPVGEDWRCQLILAAEQYGKVANLHQADGDLSASDLFRKQRADLRRLAGAVAVSSAAVELGWLDNDVLEPPTLPAEPPATPSACEVDQARLAAYARDIAALGGVTITDWSTDHLDAANAYLLAARSSAAAGSDDWRCHLGRAAERYDRHAEWLRDQSEQQYADEFAESAARLRRLSEADTWSEIADTLEDAPSEPDRADD